jgi:hypothetical protein
MSAPSPAAGYSGTPLARKLGLKDGQRLLLAGVPAALDPALAHPGAAAVARIAAADTPPAGPFDYIHLFTSRLEGLGETLAALRGAMAPAGMLWVSWPKKASRVATDVTEDRIRDAALPRGLVDVKVCAVDEVWSGLKLVIPVAQRGAVRQGSGA